MMAIAVYVSGLHQSGLDSGCVAGRDVVRVGGPARSRRWCFECFGESGGFRQAL
jgi:hypothetical protein